MVNFTLKFIPTTREPSVNDKYNKKKTRGFIYHLDLNKRWTGLKRTNRSWVWNEHATDVLTEDLWSVDSPSGDGRCVEIFFNQRFLLNDLDCDHVFL